MPLPMDHKSEQLLTLKVMRLSRPSIFASPLIKTEENDLIHAPMRMQIPTAPPHAIPNQDNTFQYLDVSQTLILPQSFGTIYLGETFSCYLRVQNNSQQAVSNIVIKADLQTATQRIFLSKKSVEATELMPEDSVDEVLHHEVTEIGTHILVCEVSYKGPSGDPMTASRYYKFQVQKPLDVKTKFYNAEDYESDDVYLEAQVQNITAGPICMEKVALEPSPLFTVITLNDLPGELDKESIFGTVNCLTPGEVRQYLYCLQPKVEAWSNVKVLRGSTNIGKLDIIWRTSMGDRGRLQTSQLQRVAPGYGDVRLTIEQLPNPVALDQAFFLDCRVTNTSERVVDLKISLEPVSSPALCWIGRTDYSLPRLEPSASTIVRLNLIPSIPGLQTVSGIRLTDVFLKRTYEYDDLAQLLVLRDDVLDSCDKQGKFV